MIVDLGPRTVDFGSLPVDGVLRTVEARIVLTFSWTCVFSWFVLRSGAVLFFSPHVRPRKGSFC